MLASNAHEPDRVTRKYLLTRVALKRLTTLKRIETYILTKHFNNASDKSSVSSDVYVFISKHGNTKKR